MSNLIPFFAQSFPPRSKFATSQIPDLSRKVVIVTGATAGVGKETAKALLQHNAKVYIATRNKQKSEATIEELRKATGQEANWLEVDLADLRSVRHAAKEFLRREQELHILFNNAGVMRSPIEQLTVDGFDMQFGTNVIGHFLLAKLLMPALVTAASSSISGHARIVTTSSSAAYLETMHYNTLRADTEEEKEARKKLTSIRLYNQSKFANAVVARELARRYGDKGILSFSCNPGNIYTDIQRHVEPWEKAVFWLTTFPAHYGALTQLWAGTMPDVIEHNGEFLIPWARIGRCREEVYDPEVGEKLWNWLEAAVQRVGEDSEGQ